MNLDPGALGADDELNLRAVREDRRVFSTYELRDGTRIWAISEADRPVTTTLLPKSIHGWSLTRRRPRTAVKASGLQARGVRYRPMAKGPDSTSAHGYGKPRDWDRDGRVQRKINDFPLCPRRT
jgi:hypothetical protein